MAHDDDYNANDNDVHREGGARRKSKRRENKRERERKGESPTSNFRYRLPGVPLKLQAPVTM